MRKARRAFRSRASSKGSHDNEHTECHPLQFLSSHEIPVGLGVRVCPSFAVPIFFEERK